MNTLNYLCICLVGVMVGCGGGGGGDYGDPIPNAQAETAGTQSVDGANDMTTLGADPANESAVGQAFAVYGSLSQMASIKQSQAQTILGGDSGAWDDACVTVDGNTATYTECDSGGATIDGTITGTDTSVDIDLTITTNDVEIDMDANLDFTATSITGVITYVTSFDAGGQTINTTYEGDYDVTLDGAGCAIGGQVEVHYTVSGGADIDVWAKAEFGPACGDVTFY